MVEALVNPLKEDYVFIDLLKPEPGYFRFCSRRLNLRSRET